MSIEILHSGIQPITHSAPTFFNSFVDFAACSDELLITSGYISVDALLFLRENVEQLPRLRVCVGMHAFNGFTASQFHTLAKLSLDIDQHNRGEVRICTAFPFHGKVYSFFKKGRILGSIVGSSNLSCVTPTIRSNRSFEVDVAIRDSPVLQEIVALQTEIIDKSASTFHEFPTPKFITHNTQMDVLIEETKAENIGPQKLRQFWIHRTEPSFKLQLKCTPKSNLNVYHGKGRKSTATGLVLPRPWYEIEIIVSNSITSQAGYPRDSKFNAVTDDGYMFEIKTQGDYSKNFRSTGGLSVLGAWIKGRLENAGVLEVGQFIDESVLENYGRNYVELTATDDSSIWLLDFSVRH
jgi:hypothetical protein